VNALKMLVGVAVALVLQALLSQVLVHGRLAIDLVLVAVTYFGLTSGPVVGLFAGTIGGLTQDALATGIVGIGGLAKTIVGFVAGVVGTQFIVSAAIPRFVVFLGATLLQVGVVMALEWLLELRMLPRTYSSTLLEAAGNGLLGMVLFQISDLLPGAIERRKSSRGTVHVGRMRD
jgi:rod shape-determining protein MreD